MKKIKGILQNNNDTMDKMDVLLYKLAEKECTPIPEEIHNNFMKTLQKLELERQKNIANNIASETKTSNTKTAKNSKSRNFNPFPFKDRLGAIITAPAKTIGVVFLSTVLITTGIVGARNISEKYFDKNHVGLGDIGISNEFIFTKEIEDALKQNVPLNLVQLDDNYYINVQSVLLDEVNFFTTFELHSKSGVSDKLRFNIKDLKISDENGNILYDSYFEPNTNMNSGYNHIYNMENSIKELFFMFGNDSSAIQELNYSFSNIEIFSSDKKITNINDINLDFDEQTITIPITKENYNTIQEYAIEDETVVNNYNIKKAIYTNTGMYILTECNFNTLNPVIKSDNNVYTPIYSLPLKRMHKEDTLTLYAYNIKEIASNNIEEIYNDIDKEKYDLIPKN